jgi:hypothetical protein
MPNFFSDAPWSKIFKAIGNNMCIREIVTEGRGGQWPHINSGGDRSARASGPVAASPPTAEDIQSLHGTPKYETSSRIGPPGYQVATRRQGNICGFMGQMA